MRTSNTCCATRSEGGAVTTDDTCQSGASRLILACTRTEENVVFRYLVPILLLLSTMASAGQTTHVTVRVLAHDAKLIGTFAGGVAVTLTDAVSGRLLAEGIHTGDTGSTDAIVREAWVRGDQRLDTEGAAAFRATLDLERPTRVVVHARGPLGFPNAQFETSRTILVAPGEHLDGNGVVLTLQGLIVELLEPHAEGDWPAGESIRVAAGAKLLCTCPLEAEGLWDANDYRVHAELWRGDELRARVRLDYESPNVFAAELDLPALDENENDTHEIRVVAGNPTTGNWGSTHRTVRLTR